MTMSPGLSVDISTSSTYEGAPGALRRICARRVSRTQRPCVRVILVFAQASSMRQTGRSQSDLVNASIERGREPRWADPVRWRADFFECQRSRRQIGRFAHSVQHPTALTGKRITPPAVHPLGGRAAGRPEPSRNADAEPAGDRPTALRSRHPATFEVCDYPCKYNEQNRSSLNRTELVTQPNGTDYYGNHIPLHVPAEPH